MVAKFTAKTTNSEIAIYFLSLMFYSINKLKFHMLFTFTNVMFPILRRKKVFAPGNGGGRQPTLRLFENKVNVIL